MAKLRYPIALAEGIARFSFLLDNFVSGLTRIGLDPGLTFDSISYFKGIARYLHGFDFDVHYTNVSFAAPLSKRAEDLKREVLNILSRTESDKVHIIGHSMGGLDARYMIAELGMADRVASLTTIGVPHRGSSFAQWLVDHEGPLLADISKVIDVRGLQDATPAACQAMNAQLEQSEADNSVVYQTWWSQEEYEMVFTPLKPCWEIINQAEGPNDGLSAVPSQKWTDTLKGSNGRVKNVLTNQFPISADHLNEIGWWDWSERAGASSDPIYATPGPYEDRIKQVYLQIANAFAANEP
jgi:triacylglycerol lipase